MAVAFVKNVGSATLNMATSGAITVPAAGVAIGNFLVARCAFDSGGGSVSISDTGGNTYTIRATPTSPANSFIFTCAVTTALVSGNSITVSSAKTAGGFVVDEWSDVGDYETAGTSTGSGTTPSHTLDPTTETGLVVGVIAAGLTSPDFTEDADSTGGDTWHSLTWAGQGGRSTGAAYKIITSGPSQTYDPTIQSTTWSDTILVAAAAATDSYAGHRKPITALQAVPRAASW